MCLQFGSFDFGVGMLIHADTFIIIFKSPDNYLGLQIPHVMSD